MTSTKQHKKVILVGDGAVGSSYAFALVNQGIAQELGIIEIPQLHEKAVGDALDLSHALAFTSPKKIYAAQYSDCADADLVVITAGAPQKPGETRLDLVGKNLAINKSIVTQVVESGFKGIFLVAANPVDVLTYSTWKFSGFPKERVIGSGTVLDSARFRYLISQELNVVPSSVHASIIGEHGDSELAVWSQANVAGISVFDTLKEQTGSEAKAEEIYVNTRDAAYDIIQAKGSTYYGIALALLRISKALLNNENSVLTVSSQLNGEYGHKEVYLGVPTLINQNGAVKIYETPLSDKEKQLFKQSVQTLEETYDSIKHLV